MNSDPAVSHLMTDVSGNLWMVTKDTSCLIPFEMVACITWCCRTQERRASGNGMNLETFEEMKNHYTNWDPNIRRVLGHIKNCREWKLAYLPRLETWTRDSGRAVLIGDAARAMLSYMAQGTAVSIEDGAALAECIDRMFLTFEECCWPSSRSANHDAKRFRRLH